MLGKRRLDFQPVLRPVQVTEPVGALLDGGQHSLAEAGRTCGVTVAAVDQEFAVKGALQAADLGSSILSVVRLGCRDAGVSGCGVGWWLVVGSARYVDAVVGGEFVDGERPPGQGHQVGVAGEGGDGTSDALG